MGQATRMWSQDTYVNAAKPATNYFKAPRLGLKKWDAADAQYVFLSFSTPFPFGAKVLEAWLEFSTYAMPETGTHSMTVARVKDPIAYSRVNWNNRPDVRSDSVTVTKSGALPGGERWRIDVREHLQAVSNGSPWRGWRITTNDTVQRWMYSDENSSKNVDGPTLFIRWADDPDEPQSLSPNEGVVASAKPAISFEYVDVAGDTRLGFAQVRTSLTSSFTSPQWTSGVLTNETDGALDGPVIYLGRTTFPGAAVGQRIYYQVKVADGENLWSDWSAAAWFEYRPQPAITVTSFDPAKPTFSDSSPQLSWTFPNQKAYQVTIARKYQPDRIIYNTGKVSSADQVIQIPPKILRWDDSTYRVIIRAWDQYQRVGTANIPAYAVSRNDVFLDTDLALSPVQVPTVRPWGSGPFVNIEWDRPTSADAFEIVREERTGEKIILDRVTYEESHRGNGKHLYRDRTIPPNTSVRYIVRPIVNGKRGGGTPSARFTLDLEGIWVVTDDHTLFIAGDEEGEWDLPDDGTAHQVLGAVSPTIIREPFKGYVINVEGFLVEESRFQPSLTDQDRVDKFLTIKKRARNARLAIGDMNIPVDLVNMKVHPTPLAGRRYRATFTAYQNGEVWWERSA